jgi:hypothetical protein
MNTRIKKLHRTINKKVASQFVEKHAAKFLKPIELNDLKKIKNSFAFLI